MKPSLRAYVVHHVEGHFTATLMRHKERLFGPPAPTAIAESSEDVCRFLESTLRARVLDGKEALADYLFEGNVAHHELVLSVHPLRTVEKTPVIADEPLALRLGYATFEMPRGGLRVMLPRFGWFFVCETQRSAQPLIRQLISAELLGTSGHGLLHFQHGRSETVVERLPSWAKGRASDATPEELDAREFQELSQVAEDWVLRAKRRQLPITVGELEREHVALVEVRPLRSIVLVGPSGTGKTAWVRLLARYLGQQSKDASRKRLWSTSTERIVSGMQYLGQWQERVLRIVEELSSEEGFLHVDHLSAFTREQPGGGSIADFFVPGIRQGTLRLVAECDEREWQRAQRSHPELCAELHVIHLSEARPGEMPALLRAYQERRAPQVVLHLEAYRRLVSHLAIAVRTSAFPGKGFHFLETLVPDPARAETKSLYPSDISEAFARQTGLPLALVSDDIIRSRADFGRELAARVIGQDAACATVSALLTRFKAGVADPERPLGVLLFVGPTGVGKTELAKQIARVMLGNEDRLVRLDMSEYQLPGASQRLLEVGGNGDGYSLAARVRAQPFSVVLFDEVEKAHPEFFDLLLGILGEGRLTDTQGRDVDFRSTVIAMTSNLGAAEAPTVGFGADGTPAYLRRVRDHFRPELVARLDHVVPFVELAASDVRQIVDLALSAVAARTGLLLRNITLEVSPAARDRLARLGYQPGKGARALHRVIEEEIVTRIGAELATYPTLADMRFAVDLIDDRFTLTRPPS